MTHLYQNKNIKTLIVSVFKKSADPGRVRRLHKYHIWYGPHFSNIGYWGCPSKANNIFKLVPISLHLYVHNLCQQFLFYFVWICVPLALWMCYNKVFISGMNADDIVKHELRVTSCELQVTSWLLKGTSWKFKSTSWNSKVRVQIHELRVQIHKLRVQIWELRVQIYDFRIQIHELLV